MRILSILTASYLAVSCSFVEKVKNQTAGKAKERSSGDLLSYGIASTPETFGSCDGVQRYVRSIMQKSRETSYAYNKSNIDDQMTWSRSVENPEVGAGEQNMSDAAMSSEGDIGTNVQEKNVDESDFSKISDTFIYVYTSPYIHVTQRKKLSYVGHLEKKYKNGAEIFAFKDLLVVLSKTSKSRTVCTKGQHKKCDVKNESMTLIDVYRENGSKTPNLETSREVIGSYTQARIANDRLVLLAQNQLSIVADQSLNQGVIEPEILEAQDAFGAPSPTLDLAGFTDIEIETDEPIPAAKPVKPALPELPENPVVLDEGETDIWGTACNKILRPVLPDTDYRLTKIISLNLNELKEDFEEVVVLGGGEQFYVSDHFAYVAKQGLNFNPWIQSGETEKELDGEIKISQSLIITKIKLSTDSSKLSAVANGYAAGRVKDQWAFKEFSKEGALVIATTEGGQSNSLFVLKDVDSKFKIASSIRGFGKNETIQAIRYIDHMAYVVTFRRTDPLFSFDLSDLENITLEGELHIPGFSTYLHPGGEGRLIGVGYDADENSGARNNVQVSLFDISDPKDPSRLDFESVGDYARTSEATTDHKAFFYDDAERIFAVPFGNNQANGPQTGAPQIDAVAPYFYSGAAFFEIVDDTIKEKGLLNHNDLLNQSCERAVDTYYQSGAEIRRVFKLDGTYVTVSNNGIKSHDIESLKTIESTNFSEKICK